MSVCVPIRNSTNEVRSRVKNSHLLIGRLIAGEATRPSHLSCRMSGKLERSSRVPWTMGSGKLSDRHAVGSVNIPLAWAMFGGSTFLLFLLCYCCQKKLREDTLSLDDGETIRDHLQQIHVISTSTIQPPAYHAIPGTPSPPPAYESVVKKDPYGFDQSPPPYDVALANLRSGGYV